MSVLLAMLLAGGLIAAKAPVKRAAVITLEKSLDGRLERTPAEDSFDVLGNTRGIYLEGWGIVFTNEVNLVKTAPISPFKQTISKEEVARLRKRKLERLSVLKDCMRDMLAMLAKSLDGIAPTEKVALGISLVYYSWEDREGLPSQVLMQAERGKLLSKASADIETREF